MPATYVVTIAGATKTLQEGWNIQESQNGPNRLQCTVLSRTGSYRPALDDDIIITENGTRIFGGLIDNPSESGQDGAISKANLVHRIGAIDYNVYATRVALTAEVSRSSETLKARLTWIASLLSAQGVSLWVSQADGPTLDAVTYVIGRYVIDILNEVTALASGTGSTSWVWNIDYNKTLYAILADSGNPAPFNLVDGDKQILGDFVVEQPRPSEYANYITVLGGIGTKDRTDTFTGDGVTVTFALTYTFANGYGYVTVNGVNETLGTGATWSYSSATNSITRTSAPANGAAISITYVAQFPKAAIADGGLPAANRVYKTYVEPDIFDNAVLEALADAYLTRDIASPKTVHYACAFSKTGLHPGQLQTITSSKHNLSGSHTLTDVQIVGIGNMKAQRRVTVVTSQRLPASLRQRFRQAFGGGIGAASTTGVTVVTGGTYLSGPASLGGSDTLFRLANAFTKVPNALKYVAPATLAVRLRGSVVARLAANVTLRLYDETAGAAAFTGSAVAATTTPSDYTVTGSVTSGHTYHLEMLSGTAGIEVGGIGQLEGL